MDAKVELSKELRHARGWILGVGILMFVMDQVMVRVVDTYHLTDEGKKWATIIDVGVLAFFVAMFFLAARKPKLACALSLAGYWGLQVAVFAITKDPKAVYGGILIKIFFTLALVRGYKSAGRAELLQKDLEKVFE